MQLPLGMLTLGGFYTHTCRATADTYGQYVFKDINGSQGQQRHSDQYWAAICFPLMYYLFVCNGFPGVKHKWCVERHDKEERVSGVISADQSELDSSQFKSVTCISGLSLQASKPIFAVGIKTWHTRITRHSHSPHGWTSKRYPLQHFYQHNLNCDVEKSFCTPTLWHTINTKICEELSFCRKQLVFNSITNTWVVLLQFSKKPWKTGKNYLKPSRWYWG